MKELRPEGVSGALPLIAAPGPGTDREILSDLLSNVGVSKLSLQARNRLELYDNLVKLIASKPGELASSLSILNVSISRGVLQLTWGGGDYSVPVIVKSEAFYEIGRFGGVSDRRGGRPEVGRIDYRASDTLSALLYALLLALQSGYEGGVTEAYMFTTLQPEPGRLSNYQAKYVERLYRELVKEIRSVSLGVWAQDYEGLRLASILSLADIHARLRNELQVEPPSNVTFNHTIVGATGRRFFPLINITMSVSEIDTSLKALTSFADELGVSGITGFTKLLKLLGVLIIASLSIAARSQSSSSRELWYGVKLLAYSFIEGRRYELIDVAYRLLRLLVDERTGLKAELINAMSRTAQDLGVSEDALRLDESVSGREALWRSLRKLVNVVVK